MKFITQFTGLFRTYFVAIAAGIIGFFMLLLRLKDSEIQKDQVKLQKNDDDKKLDEIKAKASATTQEVALEDQAANAAEAKLRASLNSSGDFGPDSPKR